MGGRKNSDEAKSDKLSMEEAVATFQYAYDYLMKNFNPELCKLSLPEEELVVW